MQSRESGLLQYIKTKLKILDIQLKSPLDRFESCAQSFKDIFNKLERHGLLRNAAAQQIVDALLDVDPTHISPLNLGLCYFGSETPTISTLLYTKKNILCLIKNADKAHLIASGMKNLTSAGLLQNKNLEALTQNASISHSIGYVIEYLNKASPNLATQANFELLLLHKDYIEHIVSECGKGNLTQEIFNNILAQKVSKDEMVLRRQNKFLEDIKQMMSPYLDEANFNKIVEKIIRDNSLNLMELFHYSYGFLKIFLLIKEIYTLNENLNVYFDLLLSVDPTKLNLVEHALTIYKLDTTPEMQDVLYSLDNFKFFIHHLYTDYPLDYCLRQLAISNLLMGDEGEMNRRLLTGNIRFAFAICNGLDHLSRCIPRMDSQKNFYLLVQYYRSNTKFLEFPTTMSQKELEEMVNVRKRKLSLSNIHAPPSKLFNHHQPDISQMSDDETNADIITSDSEINTDKIWLQSYLPQPTLSDNSNRLFNSNKSSDFMISDEEMDADEIMNDLYRKRQLI